MLTKPLVLVQAMILIAPMDQSLGRAAFHAERSLHPSVLSSFIRRKTPFTLYTVLVANRTKVSARGLWSGIPESCPWIGCSISAVCVPLTSRYLHIKILAHHRGVLWRQMLGSVNATKYGKAIGLMLTPRWGYDKLCACPIESMHKVSLPLDHVSHLVH